MENLEFPMMSDVRKDIYKGVKAIYYTSAGTSKVPEFVGGSFLWRILQWGVVYGDRAVPSQYQIYFALHRYAGLEAISEYVNICNPPPITIILYLLILASLTRLSLGSHHKNESKG